MTAADLVERVRAAGLTLEPAGDRLRVRPRRRLTPELRAALLARKAEVLAVLVGHHAAPPPPAERRPADPRPQLAALLALPLDRFADAEHSLAVRVPWWPAPLWFVPAQPHAEALVREGISRGRVWTVGELLNLLSVPGLTPAEARTVALAKLEFGGEAVEVRPAPLKGVSHAE